MESQLEFVLLCNLPRTEAFRSPKRSIKVAVSEVETNTDVNTELETQSLGHFIPRSTEELLSRSRARMVCRASQKPKGPCWAVIAEHFYEDKILQFKFQISENIVKEVGLALQPDGEVSSIQFPDRRAYPFINGLCSQIVGWKGGMLFGSFSTCLYISQFWVLDFPRLLDSKNEVTPLTISPPYDMLIFTKRDSDRISDRLSEIHLIPSISTFLCIIENRDYSWSLSLVKFDSNKAEFLPEINVQVSRDHFGRYIGTLPSFQSHPEFSFEPNLKSVIILNQSYVDEQAALWVCLVHSKVDIESGTAKIAHQQSHRLQPNWAYNPLSDRTNTAIISHVRQKFILVEANRLVGLESMRTVALSCTWFYVFQEGKFSVLGVKHRSPDVLPVPQARQLRFAEKLGLESYWVSRIPHSNRFLVIRESYSLD